LGGFAGEPMHRRDILMLSMYYGIYVPTFNRSGRKYD